MNRRHFLHTSLAASLAPITTMAAAKGRKPRILLRNGWQSQNIGDIAHYMGMMELLKLHGIDAEVRFWANNMENGASELFKKHYPDVPVFIKDQESIDKAFKECDFFIHGSASGFGAWKDAKRWHEETGKPFGVMGISITDSGEQLMATLKKASFVYFRDGISAKRATEEFGFTSPPAMGWGPDTAFGITKLRNEEKATAYLKEHGLEEGKFLCCIPRYRWTPFWTLHKDRPVDKKKLARSEEMKEHDHAPYREAIIRLVREAGVKVLVTHEDQTQIPLGKEVLYDPLPEDVKKNVVWRETYWLTDEALSIYVRSLGLFGNEMHSPIMCIANGIPAIVGRWDEQTNKGFMWHDIGLNEWLFTMDDEARIAQIPETILALAKDPAAAKAKAEKARQVVLAKQKEQFATLKKAMA
ncbi:polysaccharide pyruvyl transferase family protein [Brevifollis gellanilyticus]|uniref:Polysaccharide pyruvyl transferase n=1 Tax=Brevifollis gellanilyticus TaxID=748831 RepID=A0A512M6I2_9BACT|nr:polysaccharide pyruvyl transferase family protein [Brevifollis gellanilyticus]GEP42349.1 polysaccharide pyruvyl transferase [Brevifollis gellanilyticus]